MSVVRKVGVYAAAALVALAVAAAIAVSQHHRALRVVRPVTPAQSEAIRQGQAAQSQAARSLSMLEHPGWYGLDAQTAAVCASSPSELGCPGQPQYP